MFEDKIEYSYMYGVIEKDGPEKKEIINSSIFPENLHSSTTIKSLKLWFGTLPGSNEGKRLLGLNTTYINFITGEKKETNYQGIPIEGKDVEVKQLQIKEGDHLSKMYIGFNDYITHLKFETYKKDSIEVGIINEETEKKSVEKINLEHNIILNIRGYYCQTGIRALACDFISYKDFCFIRWINLLRIRNKLKNKEYREKLEEKYDDLNEDMKPIYKTCKLALGIFVSIMKFL